jgi:hypothetical protein
LRYRPEPQEVQPFTELNAQVRHATSHTPAVVDRVVRDTTGWVVNCTPARVTKGSLVARVEACCCGQRRGRGGETETEVEKVGKGGLPSGNGGVQAAIAVAVTSSTSLLMDKRP